jgi:hypothetical protein
MKPPLLANAGRLAPSSSWVGDGPAVRGSKLGIFEGEYDRKLDIEHYLPPAGWQKTLWIAAFAVGSFSFVLSLTIYRERKRMSRSGIRVAVLALIVCIVGASVWVFPVCVEASTGL